MSANAPPSTSHPAGGTSNPGDSTAFLVLFALMALGWAVVLLDATAITTIAGHRENGAIYTSAYLATLLLSSALAIPYAPGLVARFNPRKTFVLTVVAASGAWVVAAALIGSGVPPIPVLMGAAVVSGLLYGVFAALIPLFAEAYLSGAGMAGAFARFSVAEAVGTVAGGLIGGFVVSELQPAWGLLIRAAVALPFAAFVWFRPPAVEPASPKPKHGPWKLMVTSLRGSRALRRAAFLGLAVSMFAAPLAQMVVPVADALRQSPLVAGAGVLMAGIASGQLVSPRIVSRMSKGRSQIRGAAILAIFTGVMLAALGVASLIFKAEPELIVWVMIGLGFGASWLAQESLNIGAATVSSESSTTGESVAVLMFAVSLFAPVGVLLWGFMIGRVSVEAAILTGAAGTVIAGLMLLRTPKPTAGACRLRFSRRDGGRYLRPLRVKTLVLAGPLPSTLRGITEKVHLPRPGAVGQMTPMLVAEQFEVFSVLPCRAVSL